MKRLTKAQKSQLLDLIELANRDEFLTEDDREEIACAPAFLLDWPIWAAGENQPGCLPDSPYCFFLTERAARGYCRGLERDGAAAAGYITDLIPTTLREVLPPSSPDRR